MVIRAQTQYLTGPGGVDGHVFLADVQNLAPGINGILSDVNSGPISVRLETVNYQTRDCTVSVNGVYPDLSSYSPVSGAKISFSTQTALSDYIPQTNASLLQKRQPGWQTMVTIYEATALIPSTAAGQVLIDDEINLGPWGLLAVTYRHLNLGYFIEKPDGNGGWVTTTRKRIDIPGTTPEDDPQGNDVWVYLIASPMARPHHPSGSDPWLANPDRYETYTVGQATGRDVNSHDPENILNTVPEDRISRMRIVVVRGTTEGGTEGYRVRVAITAPNLVLWEHEAPIPAADNAVFINETLRLSDYGLISDQDRYCFVAEFRRDGKTIRRFLQREYRLGEALDHPTFPVQLVTVPQYPEDTPWWNNQNSHDQWTKELYGSNSGLAGGTGSPLGTVNPVDSGVWRRLDYLAACGESLNDKLRVIAYRSGTLAATYETGALDIDQITRLAFPTDPQQAEGCTLRIRLLACPPNRLWEYPFFPFQNNDFGLSQVVIRNTGPSGGSPNRQFPNGTDSGGNPVGIWNYDGQLRWGSTPLVKQVSVPVAANAPGAPGEFAIDSNFAYFCIANAVWVRCPVTAW